MKVIVTGASGDLGRAVVHQLVEEGTDVVGVDQDPAPDLPCPVRVLDLQVRETGYHALEGGDAVIHLANHPHPYGLDPQRTIRYNTAIKQKMQYFSQTCEMQTTAIRFPWVTRAERIQAPTE